ncbi:uncharacterized protein [Nicotiana tomentosiformis]|uniref:uncharacterized protein n=1 Tax=Nicotiana tomentosiformis TaxID=4098 RepID=UPI00388CDF01
MLIDVKDISPTRDKRVHLPNGDCTLVLHVGNCKITEIGEVHDILYVPEFAYNLLFVSKITKDLPFVSFYLDFCIFQDLSNGKVRGIGREKEKLYLLVPKASLKAVNNIQPTVKGLSVQTINEDIFLWHKRLGHASRGSLKELLGDKLEDCKSVIDSCDVCPIATHQNGVAERKHRHLLEVARAFKFQGHNLMEFWGHCVLAAPYVVNMLPSHALDDRHKFFINRDIVFREYVFPFKVQNDDLMKQICPCIPNTTDDDFGIEGANTEDPIATTEQLCVSDENADDFILALEKLHGSDSTYPNLLRRSQRESKEPVWLTYYITTKKLVNTILYPIHNYVSYDHLSPSYQAYLGVLSSVVEPKTFQKASKDVRWVKAMQAEIQALQDKKTWELVPLP